MKKIFYLLPILLMNGCYYTVPAQDLYWDDDYVPAESVVYGTADSDTTYVYPATATTTYVTNPQTVVYVDDTPDVSYRSSIYYYHYETPHHRHHYRPAPRHEKYPHAKPHHPQPKAPNVKIPAHHGPAHGGGKPEKLIGGSGGHHGGAGKPSSSGKPSGAPKGHHK